MNDSDFMYLHQALMLAKSRRGYCAPNPAVGAVIVDQDEVIARGFHHGPGREHAEIMAMDHVKDLNLSEATLYVTLEPCCHHGRTPPCTDALIRAKFKRVVYAYTDPNPIVAGKGAEALKAAGILCEKIPLPDISTFYESYANWQKTKRPFVTAKIAMSLDGKIAGKNGERRQITGLGLQEFTHQWRHASDAILTTSKTIRADDPMMNVRYDGEILSKPLYILDSQLDLSLDAKIFETAKSITLLHSAKASEDRCQSLTAKGVRCISVDTHPEGLLNLDKVLTLIGQDGIHDLWIEAGGKCFSAFAEAKLLNRAFVYVAPLWLGEGLSAFSENFSLEMDVNILRWQQVGNDVFCEIHW